MKFQSFIGVDVSKSSLDICLLTPSSEAEHFKIDNTASALQSFFDTLKGRVAVESTLVCAEYTGHYSNPLKRFCSDTGLHLWLESGAEIKLRSGVRRNKNDKTDAFRITEYAMRHADKAVILAAECDATEEASFLLAERALYVKERAKYYTQLKDLKNYTVKDYYHDRSKRLKKHITLLTQSLEQIDQRIEAIFRSHEGLNRQKQLLTSIDGVGEQVAVRTIVATKGFTKFENGRKFACHVGVAPFRFESGSSQKSRHKVSHRADKTLKTLFHMAALSAIKMKGELRDYFERKVAEGKNKMTVINAVRAKIIHRIFALIREDRTYQKFYQPNLIFP